MGASDRPFRAAIFDLDGTLADTLATIAGIANFALRELGLPQHPLAAFNDFVGDGIRLLAQRVLPAERLAREPELHERLLSVMRTRYATHVLDGARLYDGIGEALAQLSQRGAALGVLSNKPDALTIATVEGLGIAGRFRAIRGQRDGCPPKPDPTAALAVALELGSTPDEVLYIGDTATDMETARRAGFAAVGVLWGFRQRAELERSGARWLIAHPRELVALFDGGRGMGR
ncbi:MAG: HAD family hydrolase [Myxococcales bacterium]|nr:HAD family hydrolase [Myxococcales bacterium]